MSGPGKILLDEPLIEKKTKMVLAAEAEDRCGDGETPVSGPSNFGEPDASCPTKQSQTVKEKVNSGHASPKAESQANASANLFAEKAEPKPGSLFCSEKNLGIGALFPSFSGKSLFGPSAEGQTGLFTSFKPSGLFAAAETQDKGSDEGEEPDAEQEKSEDEAELLRRSTHHHTYETFHKTLIRKEAVNLRVDDRDAFGAGTVALEQSIDQPETHALVLRSKTKSILFHCFLLPGLLKTVPLKGKPGLALFGYSANEEAAEKLKRHTVKILLAADSDVTEFRAELDKLS